MHGPNSLKRTTRRFGLVLICGLLLAVTVNAYTVVMRGGRRVEIPSQFLLTASTVTYEVSPGVQVTLAVAAIDIPATEKANHEASGSFLQRLQSASTETPSPAQRSMSPATRTITNRDLELSMHRRRESEADYETRRKQLGLPSLEESRRLAAAQADSLQMELEQNRAIEQESETYWRERATALRTEMAAVDAEIAYVRSRLDEGPAGGWSSGWSGGWSGLFVSGFGTPFGNFGHRQFGNSVGFPHGRFQRPNVFVAPGAQVGGRVAFGGGATRGQVFVNPGTVRPARPFGGRGHFQPHGAFAGVPVFGATFPGYDYSYERSELITRFNQLGGVRAGLSARWRELEDEARRAGAPPGWLRP